jgi:uncharacterized membrane protein
MLSVYSRRWRHTMVMILLWMHLGTMVGSMSITKARYGIRTRCDIPRRSSTLAFLNSETDGDENQTKDTLSAESSVWNPNLRKFMAGVSAFGILETAYLSLVEVAGGQHKHLLFCSSLSETNGSSCDAVTSGPYSHIPGTEIPLALLGLISYTIVFGLAIAPILESSHTMYENNAGNEKNDSINRVLLLGVTTTMGVFSIFLMSILFNVLHQSCLYCIASATCSIGLASLAWIGRALPEEFKKEGVSLSVGGGMLSMLAAIVLVVTSNSEYPSTVAPTFNTAKEFESIPTSLIASTATLNSQAKEPVLLVDQLPPVVTADSSSAAMQLATDLQKLDTTFYGAYWCSHCYDQKQAFGKQAMQHIPYVECSKEGINSQAALCKEKKIPGYPTWEISGKLYPGEKALDEIRDIVVAIKGAS